MENVILYYNAAYERAEKEASHSMRHESKWTKDQRRPYILQLPDGERVDLRKTGKERGNSLAARELSRSKYRNVLTEYNGKKYHSKAEAEYAARLDQLKQAGEITEWRRQVKYRLGTDKVFVANYYADFEVDLPDGSKEVHEVKGMMTEVARMKLAMFEIFYPETLLKVIRV